MIYRLEPCLWWKGSYQIPTFRLHHQTKENDRQVVCLRIGCRIIPEHPNSKPLNNFDSEPGKIEKFFNFKTLYKLYVLSLTPMI